MNPKKNAVILSKATFERRMQELGISSDYDLLERIAYQSGTRKLGATTLNKAKNFHPISYKSAEIIAQALEIESHQLYLSKEEFERVKEQKAHLSNEQYNNPQNNTTHGENSPIISSPNHTGDINLNFGSADSKK